MKNFVPHFETLPAPQRELWPELGIHLPANFVLFGETGIALGLGHRSSVDFDFFANQTFLPEELLQKLPWLKEGELTQSSPNTLTALLSRGGPVKVSFFGGLSFGRVAEPERAGESSILVASLLDLAATKLKVLPERAESKDYYDVAALLKAGLKLPQMLGAAQALFGERWNPLIALKALNYFADGDLPSLPSKVKQFLSEEAIAVREIPIMAVISDQITTVEM